MTPTPTEPDAPALTYEQARDQLVAVVRDLESGTTGLADAMRLWERGERLAAICQRQLDGAKETIRRSQADRAPLIDRPTADHEPTDRPTANRSTEG